MSEEAVRIVEEIQRGLSMDDVVSAINDDRASAELEATLERFATPDVEIVMVASPTAGGATLEARGREGWRQLWEDWTEPFETFRIEVEETIDAGDQVVSLVRITGRTKTGGVEVQDNSGAVWTVGDGKLKRVEFHLDPDEAQRAAGLEPGQRP